GGLVPIQRRPFVTPALALVRDARYAQEQRAAVAFAPMLGFDEEVFEPQAAPAEEGREVVEEHRKTDRLIVLERQQRLSARMRAEQGLFQRRLSGEDQVRQVLVFC